MLRSRPFVIAAIAGLTLVMPYRSAWSGAEHGSWIEIIRMRRWVTAFLDTSDPKGIPAPADRVVASVGGNERIIYKATVMDLMLGRPVVSPDGTRIAFVKTDSFEQQLLTMTIEGADVRPLVAMPVIGENIKGARMNSPVAWTHDNRWLALRGRLAGESQHQTPRRGGPPQSLWRVDSVTGEMKRLRAVEVKAIGEVLTGDDITPQAWAPDGRRLVYGNSDFHAIIHDTATGAETDLGPGQDPTWSPDGRFIAVRLPNVGEGRPGDYVVIDANPPHRRTLLVSNAPTLLSWGGPRYLGDPIWLPDSDGVFLYRYRRLVGTPYIVRRTTGETTKMPFAFTSHSWGGRP